MTEPSVTTHLIKLCVGVESVAELAAHQRGRAEAARRAGKPVETRHVTRMTPKRREQLLAGGALYWVIQGEIRARQRILDLRPARTESGAPGCAIILDPEVVETLPAPRRPFQGWRYLEAADAPPDRPPALGEEDEVLRAVSHYGVI